MKPIHSFIRELQRTGRWLPKAASTTRQFAFWSNMCKCSRRGAIPLGRHQHGCSQLEATFTGFQSWFGFSVATQKYPAGRKPFTGASTWFEPSKCVTVRIPPTPDLQQIAMAWGGSHRPKKGRQRKDGTERRSIKLWPQNLVSFKSSWKLTLAFQSKSWVYKTLKIPWTYTSVEEEAVRGIRTNHRRSRFAA